jgi:hypothetical protein
MQTNIWRILRGSGGQRFTKPWTTFNWIAVCISSQSGEKNSRGNRNESRSI